MDNAAPVDAQPGTPPVAASGSPLEVLWVFGRLGVTSFGGPIAHLGYFRHEVVVRRKWIDEATYADLVALCQFLPGPASSEVSFALGILRAGLAGGLAAWAGFTLPSAIALTVFALAVVGLGSSGAVEGGWLQGLKVVAVAVVAQAVWGMARSLAPDRPRATMAVAAAVVALLWPTGLGQIAIIVAGGIIGWRLLPAQVREGAAPLRSPVPRGMAIASLAVFFALLVVLPVVRQATGSQAVALVDSFYRSGALVFGGGHVVLPLLQAEVVSPGWVTDNQFLAGYGAAQAVPGPLFTFSAYLGAVSSVPPNQWAGAAIALIGIFLPAVLLVIGALPFWDALRVRPRVQSALKGINAVVVGILLAALYTPVWTSAIHSPPDFALAAVAFLLLTVWNVPPWLVVLLAALTGQVYSSR